MQTVSAAGQTAQVGAVISSLSWSGPGELDLFGQNIPTKPQFEGPIRPLLQLTHITIDRQVAQLLRSDNPRKLKLSLSQQLAQGWTRYFVWETLIAAGFAVVALLAGHGVLALGRGVIGDDDLAPHPVLRQKILRLLKACGQRARLIEARHDDGKFGRIGGGIRRHTRSLCRKRAACHAG